jgi:hypothetical protein
VTADEQPRREAGTTHLPGIGSRLRELEREVRELKMKAEFLGKAAAFFAQEYR